jgi:hypothetical protein
MTPSVLVDSVAYIDAGTGSYILAAIASGVAGLWMFFRSWMSRMKRKIRPGSEESSIPDEVSQEPEPVEGITPQETPGDRG